jgi:hypothetical protein
MCLFRLKIGHTAALSFMQWRYMKDGRKSQRSILARVSWESGLSTACYHLANLIGFLILQVLEMWVDSLLNLEHGEGCMLR